MAYFKIYAGLSGGFGGANFIDTLEFDNELDANQYAYEEAVYIYEGYEGIHGLRTLEQIMEDEGIEAEDIGLDMYIEEREDWLDYYVEPAESLEDTDD